MLTTPLVSKGEPSPKEMLGAWTMHHAQATMILTIEPDGKALFLQFHDGSHYQLRTSWEPYHGGILVHSFPRMRLWQGREGKTNELRGEVEILKGIEYKFPTRFFMRRIKYEKPPVYMKNHPLPKNWENRELPKEWNKTTGTKSIPTK